VRKLRSIISFKGLFPQRREVGDDSMSYTRRQVEGEDRTRTKVTLGWGFQAGTESSCLIQG